jgi:hypothetical protein
MSQRHRVDQEPLPPRREIRARAHGERHRIRVELSQVADQVSAGVDPHDLHEPGAAWRPVHHHSSEVAARKQAGSRRLRHWKTKMWKRRSALRRERAEALRSAWDF